MGVVLEPPDHAVDPDADTPKEACGVFGVYAEPGGNADGAVRGAVGDGFG